MKTKTQELEERVDALTGRVSTLTDEIAVLKGELTAIVHRVQQDMRKVINKLEK